MGQGIDSASNREKQDLRMCEQGLLHEWDCGASPVGDRTKADMAVDELLKALAQREPDGVVIFHVDRGSQFRVRSYQVILKAAGLQRPSGRSPPLAITLPFNRLRKFCIATSLTLDPGACELRCTRRSSTLENTQHPKKTPTQTRTVHPDRVRVVLEHYNYSSKPSE